MLPDFKAMENVMMPALIGRQSPEAAHGRAEALLSRVGLMERLEHRPRGAQRRRAAAGRGRARAGPPPAVVLADEPTGNLDPDTAAEVERLLVEMNHEAGVTCVVVTHSERLAGAMDRRLRLAHGPLEGRREHERAHPPARPRPRILRRGDGRRAWPGRTVWRRRRPRSPDPDRGQLRVDEHAIRVHVALPFPALRSASRSSMRTCGRSTRMGFFEDVDVEVDQHADRRGAVGVTFRVVERP